VTADAIGTVTYRKGDYILCFGHPLMHLGGIDLPLATAFVTDFVSTYDRATKLASTMQVAGALRRDGGWSVGGVVGAKAPQVPVTVTVTDETRDLTRTFVSRCALHKQITPMMVLTTLLGAMEAVLPPDSEGTARVKFAVEGGEGAHIERSNVAFSDRSAATAAISDLVDALFILSENPYSPQQAKSVEVEVSANDRNRSATIEELYTEETVAKAGQKLTVHVVLRPWGGEKTERVVVLQMPEDLKSGTMTIGAAGGGLAFDARQQLGLLVPNFPDLGSIIDDFQKTEHNDQIFVAAALPNSGLAIEKYLLPRLPASMLSVLSTSRTSNLEEGSEEVSQLLDSDYVVLGTQTLEVATEDKSGVRGTTPKPGETKEEKEKPKAEGGPPSLGGGEGSALARPAWARPDYSPLTSGPSPKALSLVRGHTGGRAAVAGPPPGRDPLAPPRVVRAEDSAGVVRPEEEKKGAKGAKGEGSTSTGEGKKTEEGTSKEGTTGTGTEGEGTKTEEKPETPVRELSVWHQTEVTELLEGKGTGVAVRSDAALMLSPPMTLLHTMIKEFAAWSLATDDAGNVCFGVGNTGTVYRAVPGGELEKLLETGELSVQSLINDGHGNLLAGTVPHGKIYRIPLSDPKQAAVLCETGESYVWALLPDGEGGCYAATGSHGKLLHVTAAGEVSTLATLPAQHVLCLARHGDALYAGTSEDGTVCRVSLTGQVQPLYQSDDITVCSVAVSPEGVIYAGTAPGGKVYRIVPGQPTRAVYEGTEEAVLSLCFVGPTLYAGTAGEGLILVFLGDEKVATVADLEPMQITALAPIGEGTFAAGSANNCRVMVFDTAGAATGGYDSAVLDAEREATWSSLWWTGDVPEGTAVEVRTRTGSTTDPTDGTWGQWSAASQRPGWSQVLNDPARFIQYHLTLRKEAGAPSPLVQSLGILYRPANRRPTVTVDKPTAGAAISAKHELSWSGTDDDSDELRYGVDYAPAAGGDWASIATNLEETTYEWDTTGVANGTYTLRMTATDERANPGDPLVGEAFVYGLIVDNTPPHLWLEGQPAVGADRRVTLQGQAADDLTLLRAVEYQTGDDKWTPARPKDGRYDARTESFTLTTPPLEPGEKTITVRALDAAGNKQTLEVKVTIEGQAGSETASGDGEGTESNVGKPHGAG